MNITFSNECRYVVCVSVQSETTIQIQPYDTVSMSCAEGDELFICVKRDIISYKKKNYYTLVLETQYKVENINDNETIRITREKVRAGLKVYYGRLFLTAKTATCSMESNKVLGAKEVKKTFNRSRMRYFIFISPLENLTELVLLWLIVGIFLSIKWGWKFALTYFPIAYIFILALDGLSEKILQTIFNKAFKMENEKKEFYNYFENQFINEYYSDPNRSAYFDEIEIN